MPGPWAPPPQPPRRTSRTGARKPAAASVATLWCVVATAVLSAFLLGEGAGLNLLIVAVPAGLGAYFAARAAGRRLRPWTLVWALGGIALLAVPVLRDAGWPTFLAVVSALALASLALNGGRTWPGVLLGPFGLPASLGTGMVWGWNGLRSHAAGSNGRVAPVLRTGAVAALLVIVFGALFAGADAAFADLLGNLIPDVSVADGPGVSCSFWSAWSERSPRRTWPPPLCAGTALRYGPAGPGPAGSGRCRSWCSTCSSPCS